MTTNNPSKVFDYKMLRLLMGVIALGLPLAVWLRSSTSLPSISASYYTESQDIFVGALFVIAAFLWAYNGHTPWQGRWSKIAALAAGFVAYFPTTCGDCEADLTSWFHYVSAFTLFSILAYFCLGPFRTRALEKKSDAGDRRSIVYTWCGSMIIASILIMGLSKIPAIHELVWTWEVIYWGETVALVFFGIAWIVAGRNLPVLGDKEEALGLSK